MFDASHDTVDFSLSRCSSQLTRNSHSSRTVGARGPVRRPWRLGLVSLDEAHVEPLLWCVGWRSWGRRVRKGFAKPLT
jgi:hypothetical protein